MYDKYYSLKKEEISHVLSDENYDFELEEFYPNQLENMVNLDEEEEDMEIRRKMNHLMKVMMKVKFQVNLKEEEN